MFFPFKNVKRIRIDFSGSTTTIHTLTAKSLIVFEPDITPLSDGGVFVTRDVPGTDPIYYIAKETTTGLTSESAAFGCLIASAGEDVKAEGISGREVHGWLWVFELPETI